MRKSAARTKQRHGLIAALDVGTTKMCCFIARAEGNESERIVGIGHQISRGIRCGAVVDMDEAEAAIRSTVETAEHMAGANIRQVVVNLSGHQQVSRLFAYEI